MKKLLLVIFILLQSCVNQKIDPSFNNDNKDIEELSFEPFQHFSKCLKITRSFIKDWHDYGGKIEISTILMREHIQNDKQSAFAKLVKSAWQNQNKNEIYEKKENLGHWPISDIQFRRVSETFLLSKDNHLGECGALAMWNELMSEEFSLDKNRVMLPIIKEFPKNLKWDYPDNMLWLKYWLFVNIK